MNVLIILCRLFSYGSRVTDFVGFFFPSYNWKTIISFFGKMSMAVNVSN